MADIYNDNSLYATNKLGMVNQCLIGIGQRPLPSTTILEELALGTDGQVAKDIVSYTMKEVQTIGWYFNTDRDFKLTPDSSGFISVPPNLLRFDVGRTINRGKVILKGNKLYNRETQDYIFTEPVYGDAVWLVDYETLPITAYQYIALKASKAFQQRIIGSKELYAVEAQDEMDALVALQREQAQYEDYNMIDARVLNRRINPRWNIK